MFMLLIMNQIAWLDKWSAAVERDGAAITDLTFFLLNLTYLFIIC